MSNLEIPSLQRSSHADKMVLAEWSPCLRVRHCVLPMAVRAKWRSSHLSSCWCWWFGRILWIWCIIILKKIFWGSWTYIINFYICCNDSCSLFLEYTSSLLDLSLTVLVISAFNICVNHHLFAENSKFCSTFWIPGPLHHLIFAFHLFQLQINMLKGKLILVFYWGDNSTP